MLFANNTYTMLFFINYVINAIISLFKTKRGILWDTRFKEVESCDDNCKKLEENGFGLHMKETFKGMSVVNEVLNHNSWENDDAHALLHISTNATLSRHLELLGIKTLPIVSKYTRDVVNKYIFSNIVNLNAFALHKVVKNQHFPCVKSVIYHNDIMQLNDSSMQTDTSFSDNYVIGFHATPYASKLFPGIDFLLCQQRDDGFWGRGFYLARDIAQVLFYMIPYSKLVSSGLEESDRGIIFMYAAPKKNLKHDVAPLGKTVGLNIPEGIDYRLSDMGSEAVFTRNGISKLILVATIEISIEKISESADVKTLLNAIPDYFKGDRLEQPRYE
jgi:hypothetical protein